MQEFFTALSLFLGQSLMLNNIILLGFFIAFAIIFGISSRDPKSPIHWTDLMIDRKTGKVSLDKLGQFWGIAISSWIMIYLTQIKDAYTILPMMFPMYLAFLGGIYSFNKYMASKDGMKQPPSDDSNKDQPK